MVVQFSFKIERTFLSKRNHRRVMNEANRAAMTWIQRYVIPRKFTQRARTEFPGYFRERSEKHRERKLKKFGHNLPLVYTGTLRQNALDPGKSPVRATYKGATLRLRFGHKMRPEQVREMEAITPRHKRRMAQIIEKTYTKLSQDRRFLTKQTRRSRK